MMDDDDGRRVDNAGQSSQSSRLQSPSSPIHMFHRRPHGGASSVAAVSLSSPHYSGTAHRQAQQQQQQHRRQQQQQPSSADSAAAAATDYTIMKDTVYSPLGAVDPGSPAPTPSRRISSSSDSNKKRVEQTTNALASMDVDLELGKDGGGRWGFFRSDKPKTDHPNGDVPPGEEPPPPPHEGLRILREQFSAFRSMALPFYRESRPGKILFFVMILLALLNSAVRVVFSYLVRDFWSALSDKDVELFWAIMGKFVGACVILAPISVMYRYQRQKLAIVWREWMTERTMQLYYSNRVYYCLERGREIDNPDQRIAEDVRSFTEFSLSLFLNIVTSTIDMACFSVILYSIRPQLFLAIILFATIGTVGTVLIGKSLLRLNFEKLQREANFRYSLVRIRENAESIAFYAGEDREAREVDRRFGRVITNMIQINVAQRNLDFFTTFYNYLVWILPVAVVAPSYFAGVVQMGVVQQSSSAFGHVLDDLSIIVNQFESLSQFSAGIDRLHQFMTAIREYDVDRDVGTSSLMSLPGGRHEWSRNEPPSGAGSGGGIGVGGFGRKEETIQIRPVQPTMRNSMLGPGGATTPNTAVLTMTNLTLHTPDHNRTLLRNLNLRLQWNQNLLIVGPSGAGKSSLLRAVAGLWNAGSGYVERPPDEDVYFLPQRPYCPLGTLRDQLLYPCGGIDDDTFKTEPQSGEGGHTGPSGVQHNRRRALPHSWSDRDLLDVLTAADLSDLARRVGNGDPYRGLDATLDWSNTLSLGEQQRLAFGRILVNRPRLVVMDESTSALDVRAEERMFELLKRGAGGAGAAGGRSGDGVGGTPMIGGGERQPITYVSVGHRPTLMAHHDVRLLLRGVDDHVFEPIPAGAADRFKETADFLG